MLGAGRAPSDPVSDRAAGDRTISAVLASLRCSSCNGKPGPVHLVAGQSRTFNHGPPPAWALELIPPPPTPAQT